MNSILMVVVAVIVILLVFVMFSLDDQEDFYSDEAEDTPQADSSTAEDVVQGNSKVPQPPYQTISTVVADSVSSKQIQSEIEHSVKAPVETGSEADLTFRLLFDDQLPPPTDITIKEAVAVIVQIRFPEEFQEKQEDLTKALAAAEAVLMPDKAPFSYTVYPTRQFDQLWLFGFDEERDDPVFEAMVCAYDAVHRFKKALEAQPLLHDLHARPTFGIATGTIDRIKRGPLASCVHAGKAVYIAETLAEAAGDFMIYVDEEVHRLSLPLFDFREWKPIKIRPPLPPMPFFEVMGWNKKEEIFAFASHEDSHARRAVAVAFRYLEFDDLAPLLGLLTDTDEQVVTAALSTVAEIGDQRALGMLKKILPEAKSPQIRSGIIKAFGRIGGEDLLPVLKAAMKDAHWMVRYQAVLAIAHIMGPDCLKEIEELLNDEDGAVRAVVHRLRFQQTNNHADLAALGELMGDLSIRARKAAAEALIEIAVPEALTIIVNSFNNQENELRRHILRLLTECRSNALYRTFLALFQQSDENTRSEIVAAVKRARLVG